MQQDAFLGIRHKIIASSVFLWWGLVLDALDRMVILQLGAVLASQHQLGYPIPSDCFDCFFDIGKSISAQSMEAISSSVL